MSKPINSAASSILSEILANSHLSVMPKAEALQLACAGVGFDWPNVEPVFAKVFEELEEVKEALTNPKKDQTDIEEEIGDLFFACINLSRHLQVSPEQALENASSKFASRFQKIEAIVKNKSLNLKDMTLEDLELLWLQVKSE